MPPRLKTFRVVEKRWERIEYFVEAQDSEQVLSLLCGEGPKKLVAAAQEALTQAEELSGDSDVELVEEVVS